MTREDVSSGRCYIIHITLYLLLSDIFMHNFLPVDIRPRMLLIWRTYLLVVQKNIVLCSYRVILFVCINVSSSTFITLIGQKRLYYCTNQHFQYFDWTDAKIHFVQIECLKYFIKNKLFLRSILTTCISNFMHSKIFSLLRKKVVNFVIIVV